MLTTDWMIRGRQLAWGLATGSFLWLYWPVLTSLVEAWRTDDNYSHGILIVPLAAYFVWERRTRIADAMTSPRLMGLVVVGLGIALLFAGLLGAELFLTRVSILVVLGGGIIFIAGLGALRVLAFPLLFLLLMIPIPAIIFNEIAFPLQLLASRVGTSALMTLGIPVLREGNVITLASTTLEVAEACSGIRSLISLLTLGIVYGYFTDHRPVVRTLVALSAVPLAIVANAARVAGTGVAAHYYGSQAAEGFFHSFSGWLVFGAAFLGMVLATRLILRMLPNPLGPHAIGGEVTGRAL